MITYIGVSTYIESERLNNLKYFSEYPIAYILEHKTILYRFF